MAQKTLLRFARGWIRSLRLEPIAASGKRHQPAAFARAFAADESATRYLPCPIYPNPCVGGWLLEPVDWQSDLATKSSFALCRSALQRQHGPSEGQVLQLSCIGSRTSPRPAI